MDLRFTAGPPTAEERDALAFIDGPRRDLLLPALHAVAAAVGWISPQAVDEIGRRLDVAPAEVYGVGSFYAAFSFRPRSPHTVRVCTDVVCLLRGAAAPDGEEMPANCLGQCDRAPARLEMDGAHASGGSAAAPAPHVAGDRLLRRIGRVDPSSLDAYLAAGGYEAFHRVLAHGPAWVIDELTASGLVGRGGAAFPTGRKWRAVAEHVVHPHYLVCNADESEPGTYKDRVLMEGDPFAVVEAMTVAAYATGCERGYMYLRHEYPLAAAALQRAIDVARAAGLLGDDVAGTGMRFDIELRRGAGVYICGEETAIFNSIEGLRGEPRAKPPFPVDVGLFGKPTLVNNVETLVNVLPIVVGDRRDTKLFCVSGDVQRPGVYEVPTGTALSELISLAGGEDVQVVLLGGAAGSFAGPADLDVKLSVDGTRAAGLTLGSGAVIVLGPRADLGAVVGRVAAFFRDESCGQCVPCRVGTVRQEEIVHRLRTAPAPAPADLILLGEVGRVMRDASICGLGHTASSAIESAVGRLGLFSEVRR